MDNCSQHKKEPSEDWKEDCLRYHGKVLTGSNAHWCPDWDYLPIDDTCKEIECCTCGSFKEFENQTT